MLKRIYILISLLFPVAALAGPLDDSLSTSASAMQAQSQRIRIVTENIANANTTGISPTDIPYRRKLVFFEETKDPKTGANLVQVRKTDFDNSDFKLMYQPNHPAADAQGYVKYPNVDPALESMDLREAQRSYEANISAIENTKQIQQRALDLMR